SASQAFRASWILQFQDFVHSPESRSCSALQQLSDAEWCTLAPLAGLALLSALAHCGDAHATAMRSLRDHPSQVVTPFVTPFPRHYPICSACGWRVQAEASESRRLACTRGHRLRWAVPATVLSLCRRPRSCHTASHSALSPPWLAF